MATAAGRAIAGVAEAEIARAIREAVANSLEGTTKVVAAFLKGMEVGAKGDLTKVNKRVAEDAHDAAIASYEANVEAVRATPAYPRFNRRSGYLGRVVRRKDFVGSDHTGVQYGNEYALYKEAEHWRRLNFGAGAAAGPRSPAIPLRLFGEQVDTLSLDYGPSKPFSLPKGFFFTSAGKLEIPRDRYRGGGASRAFYPNRKSPYTPRMTEGIRGRHFLEEGLQAMATSIEVRYADLLNEWIQKGGRKAKAVASVV